MADCPCASIGADKFILAMLVYVASWPGRVATVGQTFSECSDTRIYRKVFEGETVFFFSLAGWGVDNGRIFECTPRYW